MIFCTSCKDERDLSPSELSEDTRIAFYLPKKSEIKDEGAYPLCEEIWIDGSANAVHEEKNRVVPADSIKLDSCREYRKQASFACKGEVQILNCAENAQKDFPGLNQLYFIMYFIGKDKTAAENLCNIKDPCIKTTLVQF